MNIVHNTTLIPFSSAVITPPNIGRNSSFFSRIGAEMYTKQYYNILYKFQVAKVLKAQMNENFSYSKTCFEILFQLQMKVQFTGFTQRYTNFLVK